MMPVVQNDTPAAEQFNGDGGAVDTFVDNDVGSFDNSTTKDDILIETLRSIRSSLKNITVIVDDSSLLYSPKSCPICCDEYLYYDAIEIVM